MKNGIQFDFLIYEKLLKAVASMSRLYSDNSIALIHPRFVEKLLVYCSDATDLSRKDISFDAKITPNIGVGIKTFVADNLSISKSEKIAEFTRHASLGFFTGLDHENIAIKSAELRNNRIHSDMNEYAIELNHSYYHCLVRTCQGAIVHEEPYQTIDISNIKPTNSRGIEISQFSNDQNTNTYFTDGQSHYIYNKAKNVLFKKFDLTKFYNSCLIPLIIYDDIFQRIEHGSNLYEMTIERDMLLKIAKSNTSELYEWVVLPLYSNKEQKRLVPKMSGINFWNANGRERKFGESYVPIPQKIHKMYPNFFPNRNEKFRLKLPNDKIIWAKVCQDNNKALMSDPNTDLCDWLYKLIDLNDTALSERFSEKNPYTYADLERVGKDSVKVTKVQNQSYQYELQTMPLGSYDEFMSSHGDDTMAFDNT